MAGMNSAFEDWRARIPPRDPLVDVLILSLIDPSLAPPGKHVLSALVQFVPEELHDGAWTADRRDALRDLVTTRLSEVSPGIGTRILACGVVLPGDIENE